MKRLVEVVERTASQNHAKKMTQDLKNRFEEFKNVSKKLFLDDKALSPTAAFYGSQNEKTHIYYAPFLSQAIMNRRQQLLYILGGEMKNQGTDIELIMFASEAWSTTHEKDTDISKVARPSQDPNKAEVLTFSAITKDGTNFFNVYDIKRSDKEVELIERKGIKIQQNFLLSSFWKGYLAL